jgi:hypothetical protein
VPLGETMRTGVCDRIILPRGSWYKVPGLANCAAVATPSLLPDTPVPEKVVTEATGGARVGDTMLVVSAAFTKLDNVVVPDGPHSTMEPTLPACIAPGGHLNHALALQPAALSAGSAAASAL